ncbi:hypothetical protein [Deinococcus radiotolerans]|uniref:Uncharacterized protein n=1 Tax=Deinococcus radiotolerans TaxID=1309407 RepID=A0ABQ2FQI8_9DEIO|nr:hypothetical protein [Deinococcus radiotolerans]GGL16765.1 hypothetical protein GCM10010844_39610 [Deinococcus radiotolerans]
MNEAIKTALAEALTAVEEAETAAQAGQFDEARALLDVVEAGLSAGETRNPALMNRRLKIIRTQARVEALLPAAEPTTAPVVEAAQPEAETPVQDAAQPGATDEAEPAAEQDAEPAPAPVVLPELPPVAQADAPAKVRGVAPAHVLPDDGWDRVAAALRAQGTDVEACEADAARHKRLQGEAEEKRDSWRARVEERFALQAQLEVCALRGDYAGANAAWDRLFDVVTAIRSREGAARRRGLPEAADMRPVFEAANEDSKQVRVWARGPKGTAAA